MGLGAKQRMHAGGEHVPNVRPADVLAKVGLVPSCLQVSVPFHSTLQHSRAALCMQTSQWQPSIQRARIFCAYVHMCGGFSAGRTSCNPCLRRSAAILMRGCCLWHAGVVSMGRYDDPNSGKSSFSMLLGAAPHLDMHYTIFGCVQCELLAEQQATGRFAWALEAGKAAICRSSC